MRCQTNPEKRRWGKVVRSHPPSVQVTKVGPPALMLKCATRRLCTPLCPTFWLCSHCCRHRSIGLDDCPRFPRSAAQALYAGHEIADIALQLALPAEHLDIGDLAEFTFASARRWREVVLEQTEESWAGTSSSAATERGTK